ncbi:type II secretion system protein J [Jannaschia sp. R86511]|uniref:PulJ/GspJ family protein n=1 Tax=Jannaschia sp. R86511 TaxID=3093853 RepID=UPI0036D2C86E
MLTRLRSVARRDDAGFTLVELMVAMFIFSILLVILTAGISAMSRSTVRVTASGEAMTDLNRLYNRLDKEVPYATALNRQVLSGGDWYLEYFTDSTEAGARPFCTQYRLDTSARAVQVRSWNTEGALGLTGWTTLAVDVVPRAGSPWLVRPADDTYVRQRLTVAVDVEQPATPVQQLDTTFVARNTTPDTGTNADQDADGRSDSEVCMNQGVGRS